MSTEETWETDCDGVQQSLALAQKLGERLKGGEVIELASDLGGGKTTFVSGIAKGIGSSDLVTSPTFTLSNIYQGTGLQLHHYDFYRLNEAGIMGDELNEALLDPTVVTIVEWAGIVEDVLPQQRLKITIAATGEQTRHFMFAALGSAAQRLLTELRQ